MKLNGQFTHLKKVKELLSTLTMATMVIAQTFRNELYNNFFGLIFWNNNFNTRSNKTVTQSSMISVYLLPDYSDNGLVTKITLDFLQNNCCQTFKLSPFGFNLLYYKYILEIS